MTVDAVRAICRALPEVTEDVKWGHDLCFCVAGKMFTVVSLERPHAIAFKCTPETFAELVERDGIIPAPYMARNMWVQEQELGEALERRELEPLIRTAYALVVAKLPKARQPGAKTKTAAGRRSGTRGTRPTTRTRPAGRK
jgi:predicted DNA-binding protein (MmcQ/YjbR family)